jgi:hypothetical protein
MFFEITFLRIEHIFVIIQSGVQGRRLANRRIRVTQSADHLVDVFLQVHLHAPFFVDLDRLIHKWLFCPISALREKFYPRNINYMPPVKFFVRLELDQNRSFLDGH